MSIPNNIYESEYLIYTKLFYDSQIKQIKRDSYIHNYTSERSYEQLESLEKKSKAAGMASRCVSVKHRELNTNFFKEIDFKIRIDLMNFFKSSNNEFVSKYNNLLSMDEYIELLDIEIDKGDQ